MTMKVTAHDMMRHDLNIDMCRETVDTCRYIDILCRIIDIQTCVDVYRFRCNINCIFSSNNIKLEHTHHLVIVY